MLRVRSGTNDNILNKVRAKHSFIYFERERERERERNTIVLTFG